MERTRLLDVTNVSARYPGSKKVILRDVDLTLYSGQITCVIGESGCGKSTLLNTVLQLPGRVDVCEGEVTYRGENLKALSREEMRKLRGSGIGVVFQEPGASLNPIRKIHVQFYEAMCAHGKVSRAESREKAAAILRNLEFPDPDRILDSCPAQLSGGMNQRVAIAIAMALDPDILLADEPTSALDVTVQAQIVEELIHLRDTYNTCILMITHNMGVVAKMADMVAVMYGGRVIEYGPRTEVLYHSAHPYTKALMAAIPKLDGVPPRGIPGKKPDVFPEVGCGFAPRCRCASTDCETRKMEKHFFSEDHWTLCMEIEHDADASA
jgi:oligopeptide/dipeptide ABC transporter ATP-binding protein